MPEQYKIIDLFAGPGGLGEGFSACKDSQGNNPFKIALSIEKEASAARTLRLRAFYRQFEQGKAPDAYYEFLAGKLGKDPEEIYKVSRYRRQAEKSAEEAKQLTLGENNRQINKSIETALGKHPGDWILIGGPPCQAYSLVGRARNKGNKEYVAESDHRNFLYKEYLKVIARFRPAVFVMENVKGMLSARIDGQSIFDVIQQDLTCPARALKTNDPRHEYELFALTESKDSDSDLFRADLTGKDFIIRSEEHGIPQARHRVIIIGVRRDIAARRVPGKLETQMAPTVHEVIGDLPKLRSGLSKQEDTFTNWCVTIKNNHETVIAATKTAGLNKTADCMELAYSQIGHELLNRGSNWCVSNPKNNSTSNIDTELRHWYSDPSGWDGVCNHETRGHIESDLHRYLFSACYSLSNEGGNHESPKAQDYPDILSPNHNNWKSGKFADRFRVQASNRYATTITSHISKDGHYYIHHDPLQCRSMTVREAARIQTFPDNYFFTGNRTQQYVQVGNAVPPLLANKIANIIYEALRV